LKVTIGEAMTFLVFKKNSSIFRSNFLHALSDPYIRTPRLIYIIITKGSVRALPAFCSKERFLALLRDQTRNRDPEDERIFGEVWRRPTICS
jgi:hypothetical protein